MADSESKQIEIGTSLDDFKRQENDHSEQYGLEKDLEAIQKKWSLIEFDVKDYLSTGTCIVRSSAITMVYFIYMSLMLLAAFHHGIVTFFIYKNITCVLTRPPALDC